MDNKEGNYILFGDKGMAPHREYTFYPFESIDKNLSKDLFSISISLRYTDSCKFKFLPLKVEYASLVNDSIIEKNIKIPLFDDNGRYKGKGNLGIYESEISLINNQPFEEGFFISLSTFETKTEGIISLGVITMKNL
ncbi:MAG: hypothetical protein J1E16_10480 [Muribaculaceae bacterium]|nr:hypothetical protein [Muribaculaceae bacterium]